MKKYVWKKEMVLVIMFLFIGASIIPNISGQIENKGKYNTQRNGLLRNQISQDIKQMVSSNYLNFIEKSCSEQPNIIWNRTYGGNKGDAGYQIRKTTDNKLIILGYTASFTSSNDFLLIKTDEEGIEEWNNYYGNSDLDEFGMDVQETSDGGYILVGYFFFFHSHDQGILLVKTDSDGVEQWNKTFGTDFEPADAFSVYPTDDGGYLILGNDWTRNGLYLIKTNEFGDFLWDKNIAGPGSSIYSTASAKTDDGGFIITGFVQFEYDIDMFVMKVNSDYEKEWDATIGGDLWDFGLSVIETNDNKYVVVGCANSVEVFNDGNAWIVQFDNQGVVKFNRIFEGDDVEIPYSVQETNYGYVFVGTKRYSARNTYDLLVVHTNNMGYINKKWILGGNSYDEGYSILVTSEDDYIVMGYTMSYGTQGSADLWLFKMEGFKENSPPNALYINGPTKGKIGVSYIWNFTTFDPNNDDIYLWVDWGDGYVEEWDGPHNSEEEVKLSHVFNSKGNYSIRAKAKDVYNLEGDWSYFKVTMPKNKPFIFNFPFLSWLLERYQKIFPILRYIIGQ